MVDYTAFHGLEEDVARAFIQIIRQMDSVYLDWKREESKREEEDRKQADRFKRRRAGQPDEEPEDGG